MNKFLEEIQEQPEALKQTFCYYRSEEGKKSLRLSVPYGNPVNMTGSYLPAWEVPTLYRRQLRQ